MNNTHLHIVSFNVPYPPDYGGVIDVYYKIKALHAAGVQVHLHCYHYGRNEADALNAICASVTYHKRDAMWKGFFSGKPFIVKTRNAPALKKILLQDDHPILFEGIHACYLLTDPAFSGRKLMVRMHNNEPQYYADMAVREKKRFRKLYFTAESKRLLKFEHVLSRSDAILCISPAETDHYARTFDHVSYLPAFHGHTSVQGSTGKGDYVLYHGNLSVNENIEAAMFLIHKVFSQTKTPLIIAGSKPSASVRDAVAMYPHITLIADPQHDALQQLIMQAHINFLPAFQQTGIKLKLLNALFNGRFCMVTRQMVEGTGLEPYCMLIHHADEAVEAVETYMQQSFTEEDRQFRKPIEQLFSDAAAASHLLDVMQGRLQ